MIFSFSTNLTRSVVKRAILTCGIVALLSGCADTTSGSMTTSSWFGKGNTSNSAQNNVDPRGPLAPPQPAPRIPVIPAPVTTAASAPALPALAPPALAQPSKAKVAILLPLTGRNAPLGQAMLNAAQLAVFDSADNKFELLPRDTGFGDDTAAAAARDAVASGAQLIIGPVFGNHIPVVHAVAANAHIAMLTLSTDTSMAAPDVFVMGFTPGPQIDRVVSYAASHGLRHFAALLPNTPYGNVVGPLFEQAVVKSGGTLLVQETYDPAKHDSLQHVNNIAQHRDQIDALFVPAGGAELALIATQLASAGIDSHRIRLLGTGLWDVPDLGRQVPFLISGWYASSDPNGRQAFVKAYNATYNQDPPRLASLGYDATALVAVLSKRGNGFDAAALTNPNGFAGLDGIFRLMPQGNVERGLAVTEVTPEGAHIIDAAPVSFAGN